MVQEASKVLVEMGHGPQADWVTAKSFFVKFAQTKFSLVNDLPIYLSPNQNMKIFMNLFLKKYKNA